MVYEYVKRDKPGATENKKKNMKYWKNYIQGFILHFNPLDSTTVTDGNREKHVLVL